MLFYWVFILSSLKILIISSKLATLKIPNIFKIFERIMMFTNTRYSIITRNSSSRLTREIKIVKLYWLLPWFIFIWVFIKWKIENVKNRKFKRRAQWKNNKINIRTSEYLKAPSLIFACLHCILRKFVSPLPPPYFYNFQYLL